MSAQTALPIDKSRAEVVRRMHLSRASGMQRGRAECTSRQGVATMIQVVNRGDTFSVRLACTICGGRCRMDELWLAFPPGEDVRGQWVHKPCVDGNMQTAFGVKRVALLRGREALKRLAEALDDTATPPGLSRQGAKRGPKAKA